MKKNKNLFVVVMLLFSNTILAVDRFVDPTLTTGNGTTLFPNITGALNVAVNGDRILIVPGTYNEPTITINKSLKILSQVQGARITLNANVVVSGFPNMKLEIIGFNLGQYSFSFNGITGGTDTSRANIHLIECSSTHLSQNQDYYNLKSILCRFSGDVEFKFGDFILSNCNNVSITDEPGQSISNRTILIIGDTIANELKVRTNDFPVVIANNRLKSLILAMFDPSVNQTNYIRNNNFVTDAYIFIPIGGTPYYNIEFSSNLFLGSVNYLNGHDNCYPYNGSHYNGSLNCLRWAANNALFPHKVVNGFFRWTYNGRLLPNSPTVGGEPLVFLNIQGDSTSTNNGNPTSGYFDLDLTVNDRGMYGGPYSLTNYLQQPNPNGGKAFIYDLDMPSNLYPNSQITIKAKGYHKN